MNDNMFTQRTCGCPEEPWKFPYVCEAHAGLRDRLPDVRRDGWYAANTCPFCGRVNPGGLACAHVEACDLCGVRSCASHGQATYRLGICCPRGVNPRSKWGKTLLRALAAIGAPRRKERECKR